MLGDLAAAAKYAVPTSLTAMALAAVAVAQPVPAPSAERLEGVWMVEGGGQLTFSRARPSGLEVEMVGFCREGGASPPVEVTYVAAVPRRRGVPRRPARSCFFAQLCAPGGTRAYCVEWPERASGPRLLLMRRDFSRMLADRSHGNHPLEVFETKAMSRR